MTTTTLKSNYTYTAKILTYDATTKVVTLDAPVSISLGTNDIYGVVESQYTINGVYSNPLSAITAGDKPAQLSTDENGNFVGVFNVPSTTFQTGQRVFRIDNRSVLTDQTTATTYSEATFTASGLQTTAQQSNFSPSVDSSTTVFTQVSQRAVASTIVTYTPYDPIAQTFIIQKDNYPNGVFINSVKLFFATKPTTSNVPITLSVVGTLNGYPNGQTLDYSKVSLNSNQVVTSSSPHFLDSTTYTEFMFDAPIYIQPGILYAIMVHSSSPEYTLYYAQQNQFAIPSSARALPTDTLPTNPTKIGAAPYVGALFESQNSITWTADQTKDLMFVIDRCVFDITKTPSIPFTVGKNLPYRKLGVKDVLYKISANSASNLDGNFSNRNRIIDALNVSTTDFIPTSTNVGYNYVATLNSTRATLSSTSVIPGKFGTPTPDNVYLNDGQGNRVLLKDIDNSFALYASLSSSDPNVSPIISDDGVSLYTIKYYINNMGIGNNVISITNGGLGYNANTVAATVSSPDIGSNTAVLGVTANTGGTITSVYVISPGSGYLTTPTIAITGANTNIASAVAYGETGSTGGNSKAKYFTKKVVLTRSNESADLRVYFTAYKPLNTSIYVYYKILSPLDTSTFESQNWQLMAPISNITTYSTTRADLIEFECAPGIFNNSQANNNISYTSTNGTKYNTFTQFAIKVVMATNDSTNVPFLTDIRALALPSGTGI